MKDVKKELLELKKVHEIFRTVLKNGKVFARMASEHKALLVKSFKKEGLMTIMWGDRTNDCAP